jgi:hypothetical protein
VISRRSPANRKATAIKDDSKYRADQRIRPAVSLIMIAGEPTLAALTIDDNYLISHAV